MTVRIRYLAIFLLAFAGYYASPVHQVTDSEFTLLVSQSLLEHHSFDLGGYTFGDRREGPGRLRDRRVLPYQLFRNEGRVFDRYPVGTAVLAIPAVAVAKWAGRAPASADGTYSLPRVHALHRLLAAAVMAALAAVVYATARETLPAAPAAALTIAVAFGTQVWSVASRGLWSHTVALLLLAVIVRELIRHEARGARLRPVLLGTLAAWGFFVRPTFAIPVAAVGVYLLARRAGLGRYALTAALWCVPFVAYSLRTGGGVVPAYYAGGFMTFETYGGSLLAHLFSPSRGLLVFVPTTAFLFVLLARRWNAIAHKGLVTLALGASLAHLLVISGSPIWWGGRSYGPRLMTDVVPWLALAGQLALGALLSAPGAGRSSRLWIGGGAALLAVSIAMNGIGALTTEWQQWNREPANIWRDPSRAWSWRNPQFLAHWTLRDAHAPASPGGPAVKPVEPAPE